MVPNSSADFVQRLIDAEGITPVLRSSYKAELDAMLHPKLTARAAAPGIMLLLILAACVVGIVRAMIFYEAAPMLLAGWAVMAVSFTWAAFLIARDLWLKRHSRTSQFTISRLLTATAGTITVIALLLGMNKPSDPASTFNALYVFVFYFACIAWSLDNRIAAAELAAREQLLRIEYRLADLAEHSTK